MKLKFAAVTVVGILMFSAGAFHSVSAQEKTQWDGIYTEEQAKRGEMVYNESCTTCHGPDLAGTDIAPPLTGDQFTANWNNMKLGDLFERVSKTMPLNSPASLTAQQYADLIAFILQREKAPAGTTELPTQTEALNSVKFVETAPK